MYKVHFWSMDTSSRAPPTGEPPCRGGEGYGLQRSCRFHFLGIQRGGDY